MIKYVKATVQALLILLSSTTFGALSTGTKEQILNFRDQVRNTTISGNVKLHTTFHNKKALEDFVTKPGIRLPQEGTTSQTIETDHRFSFTFQGDNFFIDSESFLGRSSSSHVIQQRNDKSFKAIENTRGRTIFTDKREHGLPVYELPMIVPDMYPNNVVLDLPNIKESNKAIEIIGEATETQIKKGEQPYLLKYKVKKKAQVLWEREYSDHVSYKGLQLPQKAVERTYAKNGTLFRTMTYHIKYLDNPELDKRLIKTLEIPKEAKKATPGYMLQ